MEEASLNGDGYVSVIAAVVLRSPTGRANAQRQVCVLHYLPPKVLSHRQSNRKLG